MSLVTDPTPDGQGGERVTRARRFLLAVADLDVASARVEVAESVVYHVPGRTALSGTFSGRSAVCARFEDLFTLTLRAIDARKWVDWMVGVNLVSVIADVHLQVGQAHLDTRFLFVLGFDDDGRIGAVDLFFADQERVERFLPAAPPA